MKTKAQVWGLDVMTGFAMFLVAMLVFFIYALNNSEESTETFELLTYDGESIADNLISEGYPKNWQTTNVQFIGLTTNNKINQSKLEELYKMIYTDGDYAKTKGKFNTIYDYYFFFEENMTINSNSIEGIGKPGISKNNISAKNLIKITRLTIYQNKTMPLYIYTWE